MKEEHATLPEQLKHLSVGKNINLIDKKNKQKHDTVICGIRQQRSTENQPRDSKAVRDVFSVSRRAETFSPVKREPVTTLKCLV